MSPQTVQTDNSRFNTMINANFQQESLYSISNGNLRFTHYEQKLNLKQSTLMTYKLNTVKYNTTRMMGKTLTKQESNGCGVRATDGGAIHSHHTCRSQ